MAEGKAPSSWSVSEKEKFVLEAIGDVAIRYLAAGHGMHIPGFGSVYIDVYRLCLGTLGWRETRQPKLALSAAFCLRYGITRSDDARTSGPCHDIPWIMISRKAHTSKERCKATFQQVLHRFGMHVVSMQSVRTAGSATFQIGSLGELEVKTYLHRSKASFKFTYQEPDRQPGARRGKADAAAIDDEQGETAGDAAEHRPDGAGAAAGAEGVDAEGLVAQERHAEQAEQEACEGVGLGEEQVQEAEVSDEAADDVAAQAQPAQALAPPAPSRAAVAWGDGATAGDDGAHALDQSQGQRAAAAAAHAPRNGGAHAHAEGQGVGCAQAVQGQATAATAAQPAARPSSSTGALRAIGEEEWALYQARPRMSTYQRDARREADEYNRRIAAERDARTSLAARHAQLVRNNNNDTNMNSNESKKQLRRDVVVTDLEQEDGVLMQAACPPASASHPEPEGADKKASGEAGEVGVNGPVAAGDDGASPALLEELKETQKALRERAGHLEAVVAARRQVEAAAAATASEADGYVRRLLSAEAAARAERRRQAALKRAKLEGQQSKQERARHRAVHNVRSLQLREGRGAVSHEAARLRRQAAEAQQNRQALSRIGRSNERTPTYPTTPSDVFAQAPTARVAPHAYRRAVAAPPRGARSAW